MGVEPRLEKNTEGLDMHLTVGAVIRIDGKYLLIDRDVEPFGFAGIAGHIDEGESPEEALFRKVKEESGLELKKHELCFQEEVSWNWCRAFPSRSSVRKTSLPRRLGFN